MSGRSGAAAPRVGVWRVGLGVAGVLAVAFGLRGVLRGGVATDWPVTLTWLITGPVLHDLLVVPVVAAAGWLLARVVPGSVRPAVRGGLLVAASVTVVAIPVLSGRGDAGNPSLTPLDYPHNYAIVLVAIAVVTAAVAVRQHLRQAAPASGPAVPSGDTTVRKRTTEGRKYDSE